MLTVDFYLIDAFTQHTFGGNAAAVCPLMAWLPDERLLQIDGAPAQPAFFVPSEQGFALRWFTTQGEINLCGHATLAAAHVIFTAMGYAGETIRFSTRFVGELTVTRSDAGLTLDFPAWQAEPVTQLALLLRCLGIDDAVEVRAARDFIWWCWKTNNRSKR